MNSGSLQTVLRSLASAELLATDDMLLRKFIGGDEAAFSELIRRHGRLVWAVCRHLTGSDADADDAFQATFLVLLNNLKKIRDARRLSSWLHGVAFKICSRSRRTSKRRTTREQVVASREGNGSVVPDSAWDRAMSAVHEEVGALPEILRLPFVLCCLEGKGVTEAAEQLGWKLGTFSGRLTRAKDTILLRLNARGLSIGVVAGLGLAIPPSAAVAKAVAMAQIGFVVPRSVLQLTQGVIGMSMTTSKLLAAVLLVCGLGWGISSSWMTTADAQQPGNPPPQKVNPEDEVKRLRAELENAIIAAQAAKQSQNLPLVDPGNYGNDPATALALFMQTQMSTEGANNWKTTKWQYDFVAVSDMNANKFVEFLQDRENRGWEFNGTTILRRDDKPSSVWVFRRPLKVVPTSSQSTNQTSSQSTKDFHNWAAQTAWSSAIQSSNRPTTVKAIEDEIARLQKELTALKANKSRVVFTKENLPIDPALLATVLGNLADKKFAKGRYSITTTEKGNAVEVEGDKEIIEWATALVKSLSTK